MSLPDDELEEWEKIPLTSPFNPPAKPSTPACELDDEIEPAIPTQPDYNFEKIEQTDDEYPVYSETQYIGITPKIEALNQLFKDLQTLRPKTWQKAKTFFQDVQLKFSGVAQQVHAIGYATGKQVAAIQGWYNGVHAWWPDWTMEKSAVLNQNKVKHLFGIIQLPWPEQLLDCAFVVPEALVKPFQSLLASLLVGNCYFSQVTRVLQRLANHFEVTGLDHFAKIPTYVRLHSCPAHVASALVRLIQELGLATITDVPTLEGTSQLKDFTYSTTDDTPLWKLLKKLKLPFPIVKELKTKYGDKTPLRELPPAVFKEFASLYNIPTAVRTWLQVYNETRPPVKPAAVPVMLSAPVLSSGVVFNMTDALKVMIKTNRKLFSFVDLLSKPAGFSGHQLYNLQDFADSGYVQFQALAKSSRKLLYKWCKWLRLHKAATFIRHPKTISDAYTVGMDGQVYVRSELYEQLCQSVDSNQPVKRVTELFYLYHTGSSDKIPNLTMPEQPLFSSSDEDLLALADALILCDLEYVANLIKDRVQARQQVQQQRHIETLVPRYRRRIKYSEENDET